MLFLDLCQLLFKGFFATLRTIHDFLKDQVEPFWGKKLLGQLLQDHVIHEVHANASARARCFPLSGRCRTGIIAILTTFSRPQNHAAATCGAFQETRKQSWPADHPWRCVLGTLGLQCPLHLIKHNLFDDWWHINGNPFLTRFDFPCLAVKKIEVMGAGIGWSLQNAVNVADVEHRSSMVDAATIEMFDDGFHAHWPTDAITVYIEVKDLAH
nr:hypothetical protein [uncultured Cohaesibacter sp.]